MVRRLHRDDLDDAGWAALERWLVDLRDGVYVLEVAPVDPDGRYIEHRRLEEVHVCLRCGQRADCAFVADTRHGPRWLDLCYRCTWQVQAVNVTAALR